MNRIRLVQAWLDRFPSGTYLEIGVAHGLSFAPVRAARKIGVDPRIRMPGFLKWICARRAREVYYVETTSDEFFAKHHNLLAQSGVTVALIDGLHTYEQSLRDVQNTIRYLNDGGLIVMHDCNPTSPSKAYPAASYEQFRKTHKTHFLWCGDVWKTIAHLRCTRTDLEVFVLKCDFGLGVIRRGQAESVLECQPDDIRKWTYADLARDRKRVLNTKEPAYFRSRFQGVP